MLDQKSPADAARWEAVADVIRQRRSNLNVDSERPVPREVIDELLGLAVLAPNHYRTNPHRFVVLTGEARARLSAYAGEVAAKQPHMTEAMVERQRQMFLRAPVIIAVAAASDPDPIKAFENKYSAVAGVENILLAATARGLATYWRSGAAMVDPTVSGPMKEALGLEPTDEIVAFINMGYPVGDPAARPTFEPHVKYLES